LSSSVELKTEAEFQSAFAPLGQGSGASAQSRALTVTFFIPSEVPKMECY